MEGVDTVVEWWKMLTRHGNVEIAGMPSSTVRRRQLMSTKASDLRHRSSRAFEGGCCAQIAAKLLSSLGDATRLAQLGALMFVQIFLLVFSSSGNAAQSTALASYQFPAEPRRATFP
jgi:hypothetical protein